ncbi:alcohol dehydrogenase catalytic domain-containing protein [Nocardia asiatica]|uniref:alcohol dehydrogenase catalytic domain-containing protein n=1 Tax=Nocardia asiatica TaxID=209252 RepID=UPI003CC7CE96
MVRHLRHRSARVSGRTDLRATRDHTAPAHRRNGPDHPRSRFAGVVVELGEGVEDLRAGDRVVVEPYIVCGRCDACRSTLSCGGGSTN